MNGLVQALHSGRVLVMDGAMGTELQRLGLRDDECTALWNLTHPEQVAAVHAAYLESGAEVLLTNTFLANHELAGPALRDQLGDLWKAAFENVHVFRDPTPIILADIGPFPVDGTTECRDDCATLLEYARCADGVLLETWDAEHPEDCMMVEIANREDAGPPLLLSFAFKNGKTPGAVRTVARRCAESANVMHAAALGANCGRDIDLDDLLTIVRAYRERTDLPLFVRPNAGTPTPTAAGWQYPRSPQEMADKLWPLLEAGVTMVGGCCGTTPAHIAAFRRVVDEWNARRAASR
jgi:5-methyltetrahydrofolate--homocysteine methyltransferase